MKRMTPKIKLATAGSGSPKGFQQMQHKTPAARSKAPKPPKKYIKSFLARFFDGGLWTFSPYLHIYS